MDTLTIIIKMTGLLLMVPPGQNGGPTHVLMPATGNSVPPHVALLAYVTPTPKDHCLGYDSIAQVCFVNVEGWSLDPFPAAAGSNNSSPTLTAGMANVSLGSGGLRVARPLLGANPGRRVRSRFTLTRGGVTNECAPARFTFDPIPPQLPEVTLPLTSVLEWTITAQGSSLPLHRVPLDPASGDTAETLDVLVPDSGTIELFLLHVPVREVHELLERTHLPTTTPSEILPPGGPAGERADTAQQPHAPPAGTPARHFHAYYDLLRARGHERPLPKFLEATSDTCDWGVTTLRGEKLFRSPTTFTCMLATAGSQ